MRRSEALFGKCHGKRAIYQCQGDVIKWKHFPRYWPFGGEIHWSPVNSPHKGQWRGALMFSVICAWTHGWANHRDTGDFRRHGAHYDVTLMIINFTEPVPYQYNLVRPMQLIWRSVSWQSIFKWGTMTLIGIVCCLTDLGTVLCDN